MDPLAGSGVFSRLYNMGNYFIRLILAVPYVLDLFLSIDNEAPSDDDLQQRQLILDLFGPKCKPVHRRVKRRHRPKKRKQKSSKVS